MLYLPHEVAWILLVCVPIAYGLGWLAGMRKGVEIVVRHYLYERRAVEKPLPDAVSEMIEEVRAEQQEKTQNADRIDPAYFKWLRKFKMRDSAEARSLYKNKEYRKGLGGDG